ncbi:MAG: hypothetical protein P4N60_14180 [Verrucomicrobiae bacterium]|nr:hypothetical protein [Verrucomicrobiae bacterium]
MKTFFYTKTMMALAVALAAAAGSIGQAQDQPMPPPAADGSVLPPDIEPNTPLAQVVKLVQAGVDAGVIKNYIANSPGAFNLDADKIITLKDTGVPTDLVNAMMDRDKALYLANATPPPPASAPAPAVVTGESDTAPPTEPVSDNYFNDTLAPYGSWVVVEGYGRCWRPTTVIYDAGWRPYCDRGHWVYTDCGWYWDSDYSWGVTFHYGRWFRHDRFGWCWYPDTEWAPSWVTWRSSSDYCGWAPLPPLAVYRPGVGFFFRGASVGVSFDFGLQADCFTFVSPDRFCEHHPRRFAVEPGRVREVWGHTTVINHFDVHDRFVVNSGIEVSRFHDSNHHPIEAVHVGSLPNAGRQGWRGDDGDRAGHHGFGDNNNSPRNFGNGGGNGQFNHGAVVHDARNNGGNHQGGSAGGQPQGVNHEVGSPYVAPHQPASGGQGNQNWGNHNNDSGNHNNQGNHNGQPDQGMSGGNGNSSSQAAAGQEHGNNNAGNNAGAATVHGGGTWGGNNGQHSQAGTPGGGVAVSGQHPVTTPVVTAPAPAQNQWPSGGNNNHGNASVGNVHVATEMTAQRFQQQSEQQARERAQQMNAAVTAARVPPAEQWTRAQNVQAQTPVVHSTPPMEQHVEVHQAHVEPPSPVQHSSPPAAAPSQPQSQSHDANRGSGSDKRDH